MDGSCGAQANQKRQLNDVSLEQGKFSNLALQSSDVRDIVGSVSGGDGDDSMDDGSGSVDRLGGGVPAASAAEIAQAMAACEDESDVVASRRAEMEATAELAEFSEVGAPLAGEEGAGDSGPQWHED